MLYDSIPDGTARSVAQSVLATFRKQTAASPHSLSGWMHRARRRLAERQLRSLLVKARDFAVSVESIDPLRVSLNYGCVFLAHCYGQRTLPSFLTLDEFHEMGKLFSTAALKEVFEGLQFTIEDCTPTEGRPLLGVALTAA